MSAWILSLLVFLASPEHRAALPAYPGWKETAQQRTARYESIAEDIAATTTSPREQALLVAVAYHESGFAPDVDLGPCYRGPKNDSGRCDGGLAVSMWQIQAVGEDARELFADRRRAARRALAAMRRSAAHCTEHPPPRAHDAAPPSRRPAAHSASIASKVTGFHSDST